MAVNAAALILCNAVYEDPVSHNATLLGVFTSMRATKFPTPFQDVSVYTILRGLPGELGELTLTCTSVETETECARESQRIQIGDLGKRQVHIRLGELRFPEPGEYLFSLSFDRSVVADQELLVTRRD